MDFSGVESIWIGDEGDLILHTKSGDIRHKRPIAYQEYEGQRTAVDAEYVVHGRLKVGFKLGSYDQEHSLTVDPKLSWSSYLGGMGNDAANDLAIDPAGNVYITGYTLSPDFWVINGPQGASGGRADAFVTKLDVTGAIVYSTYIGGSGDDESHSISLDSAGNIYITGFTTSPNLPIVNGFKSTFGGVQDTYVLKLNNSGSAIQYSTYLGGSALDRAYGIVVDPAGNAFVAGTTSSTNFPIANAFQGEQWRWTRRCVSNEDCRQWRARVLHLPWWDRKRSCL